MKEVYNYRGIDKRTIRSCEDAAKWKIKLIKETTDIFKICIHLLSFRNTAIISC